MWKCRHCELDFSFTKTSDKANHSRWCDNNPKSAYYRNNTKLEVSIQDSKNRKYGEKVDHTVECAKCSTMFTVVEREKNFPSKTKYFCSRGCANSRIVTTSQKKKVSESITGKEYFEPRISSAECAECNVTFKFKQKSKEKVRKFCSASCSAKFTFKLRNENARKKRPALLNYRIDCAFKFNLADYPDEFDFSLIESFGWYKPKNKGNNLAGVSRDHAVSVRYGFDHDLPPEHLAHPANCVLMQHGKNVSKGTNNAISYEELLKRIDEWDKKYN
jgi:hypothetical protein